MVLTCSTYFVDALNDPDTGLTRQALKQVKGERKQSIPDCEPVLSLEVLNFMTSKGHQSEHDFVGMIRNLHKAVDGRGIDKDTRSYFCQCLLRWLLSDLMPWLKNTDAKLDLRTMDVFRTIQTDHVRGLTRETVAGLLAN